MQENERNALDDWDLAESAGRGNEDAFSELITRHQNAIHRFVYQSVGQEETARDLTQEVFVRAWFALSKVKRGAKFTTWLFQIAVNICRDYAKSKSARMQRLTRSLVKDSPDDTGKEHDLVHPDLPPDRLMEGAELIKMLEDHIRGLPKELLQPFLLGAVEGYPYKEIAVMLGISAKAVEVRVYRARRWLMEHMGQLDQEM